MNPLIKYVVQPPWLYRILFPESIWRIKLRGRKVAFVTFDDGPVPEVTPWVLRTLASFNVRATFFMVGDNARRNPELVKQVVAAGHSVGNHSMHHVQGMHCRRWKFLRDVNEAAGVIPDTVLFRPPHGMLKWKQARAVQQHYNMVMYDVVTRDYALNTTPDEVVANVMRYTRNGSIIVFHDSQKSWRNLREALPRALSWLICEGYELLPLMP